MYTDFTTRLISVKTAHVKVSHVTILESSVSQFCTCRLRTANVFSLLCNAENTALCSSCQLCSHRHCNNTATTWSIIITRNRNRPHIQGFRNVHFWCLSIACSSLWSAPLSLEFANGVICTVTCFYAFTSQMASTIPDKEMERQ